MDLEKSIDIKRERAGAQCGLSGKNFVSTIVAVVVGTMERVTSGALIYVPIRVGEMMMGGYVLNATQINYWKRW